MISKIFKHSLTLSDNETFDGSKVLCFVSFVIYFSLAIYDTINSGHWSPIDFAGGLGALAVGFGINLKLTQPPVEKNKEKSE